MSGTGSLKTEGWAQVRALPGLLQGPQPCPPHFPRAHHGDSLGVDGLGDDVAAVGDVLHHFIEPCPLHLLEFEVTEWV